MGTSQHKINPWIPKPLRKEIPVVEELVEEYPKHPDVSHPIAYKQDVPLLVPNYNTLYGTLGTREDWRYTADAYAEGTVTTVAATQVITTVSLTLPPGTQSPNWSLKEWPGGSQLFLCIRSFSLGPQTASFATMGEINVLYISRSGNTVPLGIYPNNSFINVLPLTVVPLPLTDSGDQTALGQLAFTLNSGATIGTYAWQLGFSAAYLLPAIKGYNIERITDAEYHDIANRRKHTH